ncbi:MAG: 1,4-dihydroxy-2-naphthoate octaprenyltransferase [Bacteroidales bacterium]|nr:1,4-dihydroxy-2-naphthoate octaprenyltransferase [Bacteroidales bacterium]
MTTHNLKCWVEAMRLRTLPVSVSGVLMAVALTQMAGMTKWLPAGLCLVFAVLAQIASNFANEYFDFKAGLDRPGREGPRRGVTEGDITPRAMLWATIITLAIACGIGLWLIHWGNWWLILAGVVIALGVLAYSTGPYPLSHHGLGEVAVVFFFGIIPVTLTFYVITGSSDAMVFFTSLAVGLMGANVLVVNNYRDLADDAAVGKRTIAVIMGPQAMTNMYLFNGYMAVALMVPMWMLWPVWAWSIPVVYLAIHTGLWWQICSRMGAALNPMLGMTSLAMLFYCGATLALSFIL